MDTGTTVQVIGVILLPLLYYIFNRIGSIQKDLDAHKLFVANNYPKKSEMNDQLVKIERTLEKIFERLNILAERRSHDRGHNETEI